MGEDLLNKLIDHLASNRGIPRGKVIERLKEIVSSWATRELDLYHPLQVEFNEQEGEVGIYSSKEVVEKVENETSQIEFQGAIKIKPDAELGEILYVRVQPDLVKSLLPGVIRELYVGVREEYPKKERTGKAHQETEQKEENHGGLGEREKGRTKSFTKLYKPFEQHVAMAKVSMEDTEKDLIPTDVICERCGSKMVKRWGNRVTTGRFVQFLVCSNYPTCKFTQEIETEIREDKIGMMNGQGVNHHPISETHRTQDLPHIPDLPERGTPASPPGERFEEYTDMKVSEPDTPDLISILVNEGAGIKSDQGEPSSLSVSSDELETNCEKVLLEIERALAKYDYLQVRKKLNELQVEFALSNGSFTTVFHVYNDMVTAKSFLPFVKDAAEDLLELCGQADFTSSIAKVSQRGEHFYVISSSCPLKGVSQKTLWQMVFQPILEASKAIEIIESYFKETGEARKGKIQDTASEAIGVEELGDTEGPREEDWRTSSDDQKVHTADDELLWVKGIGAKIWFELASWAKVQGHFEGEDRNFLFNIGKKVKYKFKYPPSVSQAKRARRLFEKAQRLGFRPEKQGINNPPDVGNGGI